MSKTMTCYHCNGDTTTDNVIGTQLEYPEICHICGGSGELPLTRENIDIACTATAQAVADSNHRYAELLIELDEKCQRDFGMSYAEVNEENLKAALN